jgi:hypothetical protein
MLSNNFLGNKILLFFVTIGSNFFLFLFKNKIIFNFLKFIGYKKGKTKIPPPMLDPGSRIRDPG